MLTNQLDVCCAYRRGAPLPEGSPGATVAAPGRLCVGSSSLNTRGHSESRPVPGQRRDTRRAKAGPSVSAGREACNRPPRRPRTCEASNSQTGCTEGQTKRMCTVGCSLDACYTFEERLAATQLRT